MWCQRGETVFEIGFSAEKTERRDQDHIVLPKLWHAVTFASFLSQIDIEVNLRANTFSERRLQGSLMPPQTEAFGFCPFILGRLKQVLIRYFQIVGFSVRVNQERGTPVREGKEL